MTKQHFEALAQALHEVQRLAELNSGWGALGAIEGAAERIADVCKRYSPNFDRERFLRAALTGDFKAPKRTRKPIACPKCGVFAPGHYCLRVGG